MKRQFPEWIDINSHNSITGCTKCQDCCPANAHNKNKIKIGITFTEEETVEILNYKNNKSLSNKIEMTGLPPECIKLLPRNLNAIIQKHIVNEVTT